MKCGNSGLSGLSGLIETSYAERVLSYGPIAYWPLRETAGTVAQCLVNPLQNGTYVGVTLGQPGIGDGNTCPYFDGTNDFVNVLTAMFAGAFNGAEGTAVIWAKVFNVGVWTDGNQHWSIYFRVNAANYIYQRVRGAGNNEYRYLYNAGGVANQVTIAGMTDTDWMCMAVSWSAAANQVIAYQDGAQTGAIQVGLGVWAGVIGTALLGSGFGPPSTPWHGWLAHAQIYDYVLPPRAIANLAMV